MRLCLAALACVCVGVPALAQQAAVQPSAQASAQARPAPVYCVELIVFRATAALGAPEDWSAESGGPSVGPSALDADPAGAAAAPASPTAPAHVPPATPALPAAASSSAAGPAPGSTSSSTSAAAQSAGTRSNVQLLPTSEFQLDRVAARLRSSGRYVPVAHVAWSQTASPWGKPIEIPIQSVGIDVKGLTGSVALERGEFLHLALLLDYAIDDPPPGLEAPPGTVFTLHDSHRVRFRERNYFDHPAFGVIALVTPERPPRAALRP